VRVAIWLLHMYVVGMLLWDVVVWRARMAIRVFCKA